MLLIFTISFLLFHVFQAMFQKSPGTLKPDTQLTSTPTGPTHQTALSLSGISDIGEDDLTVFIQEDSEITWL